MADVKISALPAATTPLAGTEVLPIVQGGTTDKVSVADLTAGRDVNTNALTANGNINVTGTARRITGDFSNATIANRLAFQDSTLNGATGAFVLPNGTATSSSWSVYNNSNPTNSGFGGIRIDTAEFQVRSSITGSGSYVPMVLQTGGSERMRIDTSGNVGIGTSSPADALTVSRSSGEAIVGVRNTGTNSAWLLMSPGSAGIALIHNIGNTATVFTTNGTERMRIDASGNVGIGTSSPSWRFTTVGGSAQISPGTSAQEGVRFTRSTGVCTINGINNDNNAYNALSFATGASEAMRITTGGEVYIAGTTDQGAYNLQVNGTGVWGAGAYVNGSDARIKDDIAPLSSGLDVVAKLKPVQFRYKESWSKDTSLQPGFIAQDLQDALAGQPYVDGVVLQGPEYMSVAYQALIPLLTKALQEQQSQIDALKARVAALESK